MNTAPLYLTTTTTTNFCDPEAAKNLVSDILLMFVIWLKGM
jgi:hypothetical protein